MPDSQPRPDGRRAGNAATRTRILEAGRALLADPGGLPVFTVEAVARRAGVTRVTVYNQFGSKLGLVEAIFDTLAIVRDGIDRIVAAVRRPDPREGLAELIGVFADVWERDRAAIRRLQGLAALDPEFGTVWHDRNERRRYGLGQLVSRASAQRGTLAASDVEAVTNVLVAIVAFETYDVIAGDRPLAEVVPVIERLAGVALGMGE